MNCILMIFLILSGFQLFGGSAGRNASADLGVQQSLPVLLDAHDRNSFQSPDSFHNKKQISADRLMLIEKNQPYIRPQIRKERESEKSAEFNAEFLPARKKNPMTGKKIVIKEIPAPVKEDKIEQNFLFSDPVQTDYLDFKNRTAIKIR